MPSNLDEEIVIIPKKNKSSLVNHICNYCGKSFKRKRYFEKHIFICEELRTHVHLKESQYVLEADLQEEEDILSQKDLTTMVQLLMKKCKTLEKELNEIKTHVKRKVKNISILDWLNENVILDIDFMTYISSYEVSREESEYVFQNDFIPGLIYVLRHVFSLENSETHPIRCFQQKQGVFYIYDTEKNKDKNKENNNNNNNDKETKVWKVMDETMFSRILMIFIQKFLKWFYVWKDENQEKIDTNDDYHDLYLLYMRRSMGTTKKDELIHRLIRSKLYSYLKQNIKNVIEYEYGF